MNYSIPNALEAWLEKLPTATTQIWVAYSGGPDSSALLHALSQASQPYPVHAIHINHNLSAHSTQWASHCETHCKRLNIPLKVIALTTRPQTGESVEFWARQQRYQHFTAVLTPGAVLCTAHTQDDNIETLLMNLMRGTSLAGLSGIPSQRILGQGSVARPFLKTTKAAIYNYLTQANFGYIIDDSNLEDTFDRNFIRHRILPPLKTRYQGLETRLLNVIEHCQYAHDLLDKTINQHYQDCVLTTKALLLRPLLALDPYLQCGVLEYWIKQRGYSLPGQAQLKSLLSQLTAPADRQPTLKANDYIIYRYQETLQIKQPYMHDCPSQSWDYQTPITLKGITWEAHITQGQGISCHKLEGQPLTLGFRQGGEQCRPHRRPMRPLKKWLQTYQVPPIERAQLPLFYVSDTLVAVGDLFVTSGWAVTDPTEKGLVIKKLHS